MRPCPEWQQEGLIELNILLAAFLASFISEWVGWEWKQTQADKLVPWISLFMKFNTVKDKARVIHLNCVNHIHQIYVFNYHQSKLFRVCPFPTFPFTSIQNLPSYLKASRFWMKKSGVICHLAKWRSPPTQYRMKTYWVSLALTRSQSGSHTKMGDNVLGVSVLI